MYSRTDVITCEIIAIGNPLLIGAEAITTEGVINKVGTLGMALAAKSFGVPVYCLAGSEKFLPCGAQFAIVEQDPTEIIAPADNLHGFNLYFDQTPLDLITKFFTEDGAMGAEEVRRDWQIVSCTPRYKLLCGTPMSDTRFNGRNRKNERYTKPN